MKRRGDKPDTVSFPVGAETPANAQPKTVVDFWTVEKWKEPEERWPECKMDDCNLPAVLELEPDAAAHVGVHVNICAFARALRQRIGVCAACALGHVSVATEGSWVQR